MYIPLFPDFFFCITKAGKPMYMGQKLQICINEENIIVYFDQVLSGFFSVCVSFSGV